MSQNGISASKSRETPAKICVNGMQEEQQHFQGSIDIEAQPSNLPGMNFTDINRREELHPVSRSHTNAVKGEVFLNGDRNALVNSDDNLVEVRVLFGSHEAGKPPVSTESHLQEKSTFPAEVRETGHLRGDIAWERATIEGRLDAHFQECLELKATLRTFSQQWEDRIHEQEGLVFAKEKEIVTLKGENQQLLENITELRSRVGQVIEARVGQVKEIQARVCEMKAEIGNLYQETRCQPFALDEYLKRAIGGAVYELYCENSTLTQNLFKCQAELESAKLSGTSEIKQMEEKMLRIEEVNRSLEQKTEKIQQQLCKERIGQAGSYIEGQQTPSLVESTAKEMFAFIAKFCTLLSTHTDPSGRNSVHSFIVGSDLWKKSPVARDHHWKYLLKNHISDQLLANFEREGIVKNSVVFLDPEERVRECFKYFKSCETGGELSGAFRDASTHKLDCMFYEYLTDSIDLLPGDIKSSLCGKFQDAKEFTKGFLSDKLSGFAIDKRNLVRSLILAADKVWQFHKLCLSFEPPATIFRVASGETFNQHYMESTDALETDNGSSVPTVAFMVYPGFRLRKAIIKCEVYVAIDTSHSSTEFQFSLDQEEIDTNLDLPSLY